MIRVEVMSSATRGLRRAVAGAVAVLTLSGCTDWAGYDLDYLWGYIPALATLRGSVAYDPYELPRVPAENAVPVASPMGDVPAPFTQQQLDSAAVTLMNPFSPAPEEAVVARGAEVYFNHCIACHGADGAGNGPVVGPGKYPFAPPINGAATAARSDGYLYGVIAVGRGLMPPYGERIPHLDRWAAVEYVRLLQRQSGAPAAPAPGQAGAAVAGPTTAPAAPAPGTAEATGQPPAAAAPTTTAVPGSVPTPARESPAPPAPPVN